LDDEKYEQADIKLMVFGQEVHDFGNIGWKSKIYGEDENVDIEDMMSFYREFMDCGYGKGGVFQQEVRKLIDQLRNKNSELKIEYLWNNILKLGLAKNNKRDVFRDQWYDEVIKPHLNPLIPQEIEILKPDYIVFFTGPTSQYEGVIDDVFGTPERKEVVGFDKKDLCEVVIPCAKKAYRTYHPMYLRRHPEFKKKVFDAITDDLTVRINHL
jgi:hypothetical protein